MTRMFNASMSATSFATASAERSVSWWLWTSMNGNFARLTSCPGTTSVDFGSYSSTVIEGTGVGQGGACPRARPAANSAPTPRICQRSFSCRASVSASGKMQTSNAGG